MTAAVLVLFFCRRGPHPAKGYVVTGCISRLCLQALERLAPAGGAAR